MDTACLTSPEDLPPPTGRGPVRPCLVTPLEGSSPHALLFDLTHDNESPLHKRSAEDVLSTGALVTFSGSAIGSTKGFDDIYPKLLDIVGDNRLYEVAQEGEKAGISMVKRLLNHLHAEMALEGFSEGHVHQETDVRFIPIYVTCVLMSDFHSILQFTASIRRQAKDISLSHILHLTKVQGIEDIVSPMPSSS
jgi:Central domain of human glycogen debranching enzyme